MRYLVKARVREGCEKKLLQAVDDGSLGRGSVAGDEYIHDLKNARLMKDGVAQWVEVCFCEEPLSEERPYWEKYFEPLRVRDAHARANCRDLNGEEPWACCDCDCTGRLEEKLGGLGEPFLPALKRDLEKPAALACSVPATT
jgi:hypothetical protein